MYTCPCCGYLTFETPPGTADVCEICFWADDAVQLVYVDYADGQNDRSLIEAQAIYATIGAMDPKFLKNVRKPGPKDRIDGTWRTFDIAKDAIPEHPEDFDEYADGAVLPPPSYYWRGPGEITPR